jgi:tetratricopeptide (TPR) repeat protein
MGMAGAWDQRLHAMDYLTYAYLQRGDYQSALGVFEELKQIKQADPPSPTVAYAVTAIPARLLLERGKWREAASFSLPQGLAALPALANHRWAMTHVHFANAVGAARSGDLVTARQKVAELGMLEQSLKVAPGEYDWRTQVAIEKQIAEAWIAFASGDRTGAVRIMRAAADLDDATEKHPVTPGAILPAREQLGELMLSLDRPGEALVEYEAALRRAPRRLSGLSGAAQAAKRSGDKRKLAGYKTEIAKLTWSNRPTH